MARQQNVRAKIMDAAEYAMLEKGFAATSIEELIEEVGVSKSGFFYHFRDKSDLAIGILERYLKEEEEFHNQVFGRAMELADDPLSACLIALKLYSEFVADPETGHRGSMISAICFQERLYDSRVRDLNQKAVLDWRNRFVEILQGLTQIYDLKANVTLDDLADNFLSVVEGGMILSRASQDRKVLSRQILVFREFFRMCFVPKA